MSDTIENDKLDARILKTRETLIRAADQLFFTEGWDAVTHLNLSRETGIGRATVYRHFHDMNELRLAILVECNPMVYFPQPSGHLRQDLIAVLKLLITFMNESELDAIIHRTMIEAKQDSNIAKLYDILMNIIFQPILSITDSAYNAGLMRVRPNQKQIGMQIFGPFLYSYFDCASTTPDQDIERIVDGFLELNGAI